MAKKDKLTRAPQNIGSGNIAGGGDTQPPRQQAPTKITTMMQYVRNFPAEHPTFVKYVGYIIVFAVFTILVSTLVWLLLPAAPLLQQNKKANSEPLPSPSAASSLPSSSSAPAIPAIELSPLPSLSAASSSHVSPIDISNLQHLESFRDLIELHTELATKALAECKDAQSANENLSTTFLYMKGKGAVAWEDAGISTSEKREVLERLKKQQKPAPIALINVTASKGKYPKTLTEAFEAGFPIAIPNTYVPALKMDTKLCGKVWVIGDGPNPRGHTVLWESGGNTVDEKICKVTKNSNIVAVGAVHGPENGNVLIIPEAFFGRHRAPQSTKASSQPCTSTIPSDQPAVEPPKIIM